MFLPLIKEKEKILENRLEMPNYSEEYYKYLEKKNKEEKKETVIHIQIY